MILVLLGTQNNSFERLLKAIQELIDNETITEEVVVQAGCTKFTSRNMKIFDLIAKNELEELIDKANLIVTHGGVGSIMMGLQKDKKVIAVPRLKKYKEHVNDHQIQIVDNFHNSGYIVGINNMSDLEKEIVEITNFIPKKFESNTKNMIELIENYIDSL